MKKTTKLILFMTVILFCAILFFVGLYVIFELRTDGKMTQNDSQENLIMEEDADGANEANEARTDMFNEAGADASNDVVADKANEDTMNESKEDRVTVSDMPAASVAYVERVDEPYELWLTASVVTGLTFEYPEDFEIKDLYVAAETAVEDSQTSKGIYLVFTADGQTLCVRSVPLEAERTAAGTIDVYSEFIGYATFEVVSAEGIPAEFYKKELSNETLNTLVEQSVQVYLSYH